MEGFGVSEQAWRKGPWTPEEDKLLVEYVSRYGDGRWSCVSKCAGMNRSGKSCRLRWVNYLRPGLKKGHITPEEEGIIIELHALLGNKWSSIARYLPGRTDNEIKNYWRTHFKKRSSSEQKSKIQCHKQQLEEKDKYECSNLEASSRREEEREGKRETVSECRSMGSDLNQLMNYSRGCWSDYFVPLDDYLFGVDDQNGCSKMAIQNQDNNIASYSRGGGDAVNYM